MRRFAIVPVVVLCVAAVFTGVTQVAPKWARAAGLDFWNLGDEGAHLRAAKTEGLELDTQSDRRQRWAEATDRVAASLFEGNLTLPEAIEAMTTVARTDPEWFDRLRTSFRLQGFVPQTPTDRDVVTHYLLMKIDSMRTTAELLGDPMRTATVSARVVQLDEELRQARRSSAIASAH